MKRFLSVFLFVFGLVSLLLLFVNWGLVVFPAVLFFGSWVNSKHGQAWHAGWIKKNPHVAQGVPAGSFLFPERDSKNKRILTVYDTIVTGVLEIKNGIDSQDLISALRVGEQVLLEADPNNEDDEIATKVLNMDGYRIGWIPKGNDLDSTSFQADIFQRLTDGVTVLARVNKKYVMEDGNIGIVIDVARYAVK